MITGHVLECVYVSVCVWTYTLYIYIYKGAVIYSFLFTLKRKQAKAWIDSHQLSRQKVTGARPVMALFPGPFHETPFPTWNAGSLWSWQSLLEEPGKVQTSAKSCEDESSAALTPRAGPWPGGRENSLWQISEVKLHSLTCHLASQNPGCFLGQINMVGRTDPVS